MSNTSNYKVFRPILKSFGEGLVTLTDQVFREMLDLKK